MKSLTQAILGPSVVCSKVANENQIFLEPKDPNVNFSAFAHSKASSISHQIPNPTHGFPKRGICGLVCSLQKVS